MLVCVRNSGFLGFSDTCRDLEFGEECGVFGGMWGGFPYFFRVGVCMCVLGWGSWISRGFQIW